MVLHLPLHGQQVRRISRRLPKWRRPQDLLFNHWFKRQLQIHVSLHFFATSPSTLFTNLPPSPGYESIPTNWYKRSPTDPYDIPFLAADALYQASQYPQFGSIGGNTGRTNTFTGIDPSNLTAGVYNSASLLQGNNLMCYGLRASLQQGPVILSAIYKDATAAITKLGQAFAPVLQTLACPELVQANEAQFDGMFAPFPGYAKLKKATGTYA